MDMNKNFEYDAFISYRHEEPDMTIAKKLIAALEKYSAPIGVSKNGIRKIKKVFMDRNELPATDDLSESIKYALQNSRFLIVICSPHVRKKPEWIENEIQCFTKFRGKQYIQTLLIEGEPEEAFPDSLLFEKVKIVLSEGNDVDGIKKLEFLAADIRPDELKQRDKTERLAYGVSPITDKLLLKKALKLLKTERLRCLAPMFGCKYDNLYRRHMRRSIRNIVIVSAAVILLLGGFLGYAVNMNRQLAIQIEETGKQKSEADRQASIALTNEEKAKQNAEEATRQQLEAERQAELARANEEKAVKSSAEAEKQRIEAERQAEIAKINENKAEESSAEAQRQRNEAEKAREEAEVQRNEAEVQRNEAEKQTDIATEERNNALRSQSLFLADLSEQQLEKGDRVTAALLALEAMPKDLDNPDRPLITEAEEALRNAVQKTYEDFIPQQHLRGNAYFLTVDINQDSSKLVTTSEGDQYASLWDTNSGNLIRKLEVDGYDVRLAKFSPDGSKIVTSTTAHTVLWDTKTGSKLSTLATFCSYDDGVGSVNFNSDGSRIIIYDEVYDVNTGKHLYTLKGHDGFILTAKFSPDGKQIVTASSDQTAKVWDAVTGKLVYTLEGHNERVISAEYSPDGGKILTTSGTKIMIWYVWSGKILSESEVPDGRIESAVFSNDNVIVITESEIYTGSNYSKNSLKKITEFDGVDSSAVFCSDDNNIITVSGDCRMWNKYTGTLKNTLIQFSGEQSDQYHNYAVISQDGNMLVVLSGKNVMVWQTAQAVPDYQYNAYTNKILDISPDNNKLISYYYDSATIWDRTSGEPLLKLEGHTSSIIYAEFSPDGSKVMTVSYDKSAIIWDTINGQIIHRLQSDDYINFAHFSNDGRKVLTAGITRLIVWDAASGKQLSECKNNSLINAAEFNPDGDKIVASLNIYDYTPIWEVSTGKLLAKLEGHDSIINTAKYSPDGSKIVTTSLDGTARIWDSVTGMLLVKLVGHTDDVTNAEFSPDGSKVVTVSRDETAIVWDAVTGILITRFVGHKDIIKTAVFNPEGNKILTASEDGAVYIWDIATGKTVSKFQPFFSLDSAQFSLEDNKIVIFYYNNIEVLDFKPLNEVLADAFGLIAGHELTDVEKQEFYLE